MRITLVSPWSALLAEGQGGIENFLILIANDLVDRGHDVTVVSVTNEPCERVVSERLRMVGVTTPETIASITSDLWFFQQFPDWARLTPDRTILLIHNRPTADGPFGVFPPAPDLANALDLLREAPHLCACSEWLGGTIGRMTGREGISVVYPAVAPAFGNQTALAKQRIVLFAGRLLWRKGLREIGELADRNAFGAPVHVTDFRPASVRADEAGDIREFLLSCRNVTLTPPAVSVQAMARQMATASVVAVPSTDEPFGMVSIEAQAAGTRVVGWNSGGLAETASPAATFVDPGDVDALVAAIREAINSPHVTPSVRLAVTDKFSPARSVESLLDVARLEVPA